MEIKKSVQADIENRQPLFFELGMIMALLVVWGAFEWTTKEVRVAPYMPQTKFSDDDDVVFIDQTTPPPAPPETAVPQLTEVIEIVDDWVDVEDFIIKTEDDINEGVLIQDYKAVVEDKEVDEDEVPFQFVEQAPLFQGGGANEFTKWVNQRVVYPEMAKEMGIQGRVYLQFTVGKDGSVSNVKVLRGVDASLDNEAVRVVSSSPKWTPGKQRDRAVKVTYTFPVVFQLR